MVIDAFTLENTGICANDMEPSNACLATANFTGQVTAITNGLAREFGLNVGSYNVKVCGSLFLLLLCYYSTLRCRTKLKTILKSVYTSMMTIDALINYIHLMWVPISMSKPNGCKTHLIDLIGLSKTLHTLDFYLLHLQQTLHLPLHHQNINMFLVPHKNNLHPKQTVLHLL